MEFSITNESCRVCLRKTPTGKHLSEPAKGKHHADQRTMLDLFQTCTGFTDPPWLQPETNTFFPRKICAICETLLLASVEFRKQSTKSEKVLQHILHFYDDDEACSVVEETIKHDQSYEDFAETDKRNSTESKTANVDEKLVDDKGLELLQEAASLLEADPQSTILDAEECEVARENKCGRAIEIAKRVTSEQDRWESIEHHNDVTANDGYADEDIVLDELKADTTSVAFDDFESMIDEDDEDKDDVTMFTETKNPSTSNYVDCPDCGKLITVRYLSKHRETHQDTQRYECDICQMRFTFPENLSKHKRIHQNDKRYACPYCMEMFLHWTSRRYHIDRVHTKEKRFACEYCGAKFRQSSHYQIHLRRHTGSTPFACSQCGRSFISKYSLKEHMLSHSDKKDFQCTHCYKLYKTIKSLRVHSKTHSNTKEYVCSVCEKTFSQNHSLRKHHMLAHPEFELPPPGTIANIKAINRLKNEEMSGVKVDM